MPDRDKRDKFLQGDKPVLSWRETKQDYYKTLRKIVEKRVNKKEKKWVV